MLLYKVLAETTQNKFFSKHSIA